VLKGVLARILLAGGVGLAASLPLAASALAAGPPAVCTVGLTIFTTSVGTRSESGPVTHFRESGVGGGYTSGFLAGYTISGSQDIMVNSRTQSSQLQGSFVATSPTNPADTLTIKYTGQADLATGAATGNFRSAGGTGALADLHWEGTIAAQQPVVGVPLFQATDSGPCHRGP
jgi:hypothetical protein